MKEDHPLVELKEYNESDKGDSDENDENVCQWILHVNKHFEIPFFDTDPQYFDPPTPPPLAPWVFMSSLVVVAGPGIGQCKPKTRKPSCR